jgi:uncharacterized protein YjeT (DUF2065 family)
MASQVEVAYAAVMLIFGVSHAVQPRLWADFFLAMKRTGSASLIIGMYTVPFALVIVLGHNRWNWDWPLFITISGWCMMIKSIVYLVLPNVSERIIINPRRFATRSGLFRVSGAFMVVVGGILAWHAFTSFPAPYGPRIRP